MNRHFWGTCATLWAALMALAFLTMTPPAQAAEPSEAQMCGAIAAKFAAVNEQLQETRRLCEQGAYRDSNDPLLAMRCLGQYAASGGSGDMSVQITRCEKIACEKAASQAGYICDYVMGMSMPGNVAMGGSLGTMAGSGDLGQGRFGQTNNDWLFIPLQQ